MALGKRIKVLTMNLPVQNGLGIALYDPRPLIISLHRRLRPRLALQFPE